MGAIRLRKTCVVVVLGLFVQVSVHTVDAAEAKQKHKRILIVYPQEMRTPGELAADRGIRAVLGDKLDVELYSEHLHQYLFPDERFQAEQLDWFRNKYQNQSIDLVITAGTILPNFLPGVPVVFCCVEATGLPTTKLPANVTGTWLTLDFMGTVEAARRLQPKAQQVVVLSGTTAWDRQVGPVGVKLWINQPGRRGAWVSSRTLRPGADACEHMCPASPGRIRGPCRY